MTFGFEFVLKGSCPDSTFIKTIPGTKNGSLEQFKTFCRALEKGLVSTSITEVVSKQLTVHNVSAGA